MDDLPPVTRGTASGGHPGHGVQRLADDQRRAHPHWRVTEGDALGDLDPEGERLTIDRPGQRREPHLLGLGEREATVLVAMINE
ncbi:MULTISPECIES: hypothetical protein [unclassified Streptomyces]|uniref:hypothetical protein n=1 Tax=unclassified Streptomyces TaxID=2593676 RepID=UPI002473C6C2|nr:hypothetical protein [Streptomyces sp. SAI-119]MDH6455729.1 hypothetical protein [Streptomyces sp. SAI-119]